MVRDHGWGDRDGSAAYEGRRTFALYSPAIRKSRCRPQRRDCDGAAGARPGQTPTGVGMNPTSLVRLRALPEEATQAFEVGFAVGHALLGGLLVATIPDQVLGRDLA